MSTEFRTLDLSTNNLNLYPLSTIKTDRQYLSVPNRAFPTALFQDVADVYFNLTGKELSPEENTIVGNYQDGDLKRIYGPKAYLYANEEGVKSLGIRWGQEVINLVCDADNKVFYSPNGEKVELEIAEAKVGNFDSLCLQGAIDTSDGAILTFNFPIALVSYDKDKKPKAKALTTLLGKKGFDSISEYFAEAPKGNGDSEPVYKAKDLQPGIYNILEWKGVKENTIYIVRLQGAVILGEEEETVAEGDLKLWAPNKLVSAIKVGLIQEGAAFEKIAFDNDKTLYNIIGDYEDNDSTLDLSWL